MKYLNRASFMFKIILCFFLISPEIVLSSEPAIDTLINVQKYNRSIHIMAMLLVGFGFLMVFIRKYGRTSVTATYLLVSVSIPLYFLKSYFGLFGEVHSEIDTLILAEFAAASLLICAGAPMGRLKLKQYLILGILFIPCYSFNEWILLDNGLKIIKSNSFVDTGGSVVIHAFGAIFGLALVSALTKRSDFSQSIETDDISDKFSLLGSMVLWLFWPSFCAALVKPELIPHTIINVILALSGATLATYFSSILMRKKLLAADIANASLAGGVAIGSVCDFTGFIAAFCIGLLAGFIATFGFVFLQKRIEQFIGGIDTCGIVNLHGMPGLMGGLSAIFLVEGINKTAQLSGIFVTIFIASITGFLSGKILKLLTKQNVFYDDNQEFEV